MRDRDYIDGSSADPARFFCSYSDLEETKAGMWRGIHGKARAIEAIAQAVSLLRDKGRAAAAFARVLSEWPVSCRAEFTSPGNHLAWLGQAACCLEHGVPESLTRRAWWKLTEDERAAADALATSAISTWKDSIKTPQLRLFGGAQ
jgi:hypothetical protein